jgi:hypothetical protein
MGAVTQKLPDSLLPFLLNMVIMEATTLDLPCQECHGAVPWRQVPIGVRGEGRIGRIMQRWCQSASVITIHQSDERSRKCQTHGTMVAKVRVSNDSARAPIGEFSPPHIDHCSWLFVLMVLLKTPSFYSLLSAVSSFLTPSFFLAITFRIGLSIKSHPDLFHDA